MTHPKGIKSRTHLSGASKGKKTTEANEIEAHQQAFMSAFVVLGTVSASARAAGINPQQVRIWEKVDPVFVEQFEVVKEEFADRLESMAIKRAMGQCKRAVLFKGEQVKIKNPKTGKWEDHWESEYADQVLMFLLKGLRPDKYRERKQVDVDGSITYKEVKGVSPDDL